MDAFAYIYIEMFLLNFFFFNDRESMHSFLAMQPM